MVKFLQILYFVDAAVFVLGVSVCVCSGYC